MRKTLSLILTALLLALVLSACTAPEDKALNSLGEYKSYEYYIEGVFQDFTCYAKYYYDSVDFTNNEYFSKIGSSDMDVLNEHLDDFESWIETYRKDYASCEIVINYDFDRSIIDSEDYLYIESKQYNDPWNDGNMVFASYNIYFFDIQTNTLYYFHNNI